MNFFIDLRYLFAPLVNLFLFLILTDQNHGRSYNNNWDQNDAQEILQYLILKLPFLILVIILLLFFLFTTIKLPLTAKPIRLISNTGNFSIFLAMAILASIILPPSAFWVVYLFLIVISPWYGILWSLFEHLFNWVRQSSLSIPTIFIICLTQNQENSEAVPTAAQNVEEGIGRLEIESNRFHGLEQELVVVING